MPEYIGLYLPKPVFSHGQLSVALSCVGNKDRITIMVVDGKIKGMPGVYTKNIVFKEVFC